MDTRTSYCISSNGKELWLSSGFNTSVKIYGKFSKVTISSFPYVIEQKEPMSYQRNRHALIYLKNKIFAIGGQGSLDDLNEVEVYHVAKDYWEDLEPLNQIKASCKGGAIADRIYVFDIGGLGDSKVQQSIEYLDTRFIYNLWVEITLKAPYSSTQEHISGFQSFEENKIIILQPYGRKLFECDVDEEYIGFKFNMKSPFLKEFTKQLDLKTST